MAFNDRQELRRVVQVLKECSANQIASLICEARKGSQERDNYGSIVIYLENDEEEDTDED